MKTSQLLAAAVAATFAGVASAGTYTADIDVETTVGVDDSGVVFSDTFAAGAVASVDSISIELAHSWAGDVDVVLTAPDGGTVEVQDFGGAGNLELGTNIVTFGLADVVNYTFTESGGADPTAAATPVPGGTYSGVNGAPWDDDSFGGVWTVTVSDDAGGDAGAYGTITVEWTDVPEPGSLALLGLGGLALLRRRR